MSERNERKGREECQCRVVVRSKSSERVENSEVGIERTSIGGGVVGVLSGSDSVDLLVHLSPVVETVLSSSSDREHDLRRMPSSNTSDLIVEKRRRGRNSVSMVVSSEKMKASEGRRRKEERRERTFRRPLWVFLGSFLVPHRAVTPSNP